MEKRRIRLDIDGVVCRLITQEDDRYMEDLAKEIGEQLEETRIVSPYITREAAALTAALNYCDEAKKKGRLNALLKDRVEELEVEKELWLEEKAELKKRRRQSPTWPCSSGPSSWSRRTPAWPRPPRRRSA